MTYLNKVSETVQVFWDNIIVEC